MGFLDTLKSEIKVFVPQNKQKTRTNYTTPSGRFIKSLKTQIKYIDMIEEDDLEHKGFDYIIEKLKENIEEHNKGVDANLKVEIIKPIKGKRNLWFKKEENKKGDLVYITLTKIGVKWYNIMPDVLVGEDGEPLPGDKAAFEGTENIESIKKIYQSLIKAARNNELDGIFEEFEKEQTAAKSNTEKA